MILLISSHQTVFCVWWKEDICVDIDIEIDMYIDIKIYMYIYKDKE